MAKKTVQEEQTEILRNLLIVQLALAGVPTHKIRAIASCGMNQVTKITKFLGKNEHAQKNRG
jgi:hypothetical protein